MNPADFLRSNPRTPGPTTEEKAAFVDVVVTTILPTVDKEVLWRLAIGGGWSSKSVMARAMYPICNFVLKGQNQIVRGPWSEILLFGAVQQVLPKALVRVGCSRWAEDCAYATTLEKVEEVTNYDARMTRTEPAIKKACEQLALGAEYIRARDTFSVPRVVTRGVKECAGLFSLDRLPKQADDVLRTYCKVVHRAYSEASR